MNFHACHFFILANQIWLSQQVEYFRGQALLRTEKLEAIDSIEDPKLLLQLVTGQFQGDLGPSTAEHVRLALKRMRNLLETRRAVLSSHLKAKLIRLEDCTAARPEVLLEAELGTLGELSSQASEHRSCRLQQVAARSASVDCKNDYAADQEVAYKCLEEGSKSCSQELLQVGHRQGVCEGLEEAHEKLGLKCHEAQQLLQVTACEQVKRSEACDTYHACHDQQSKAFRQTKDDIALEEGTLKEHEVVLGQIDCIVRAGGSARQCQGHDALASQQAVTVDPEGKTSVLLEFDEPRASTCMRSKDVHQLLDSFYVGLEAAPEAHAEALKKCKKNQPEILLDLGEEEPVPNGFLAGMPVYGLKTHTEDLGALASTFKSVDESVTRSIAARQDNSTASNNEQTDDVAASKHISSNQMAVESVNVTTQLEGTGVASTKQNATARAAAQQEIDFEEFDDAGSQQTSGEDLAINGTENATAGTVEQNMSVASAASATQEGMPVVRAAQLQAGAEAATTEQESTAEATSTQVDITLQASQQDAATGVSSIDTGKDESPMEASSKDESGNLLLQTVIAKVEVHGIDYDKLLKDEELLGKLRAKVKAAFVARLPGLGEEDMKLVMNPGMVLEAGILPPNKIGADLVQSKLESLDDHGNSLLAETIKQSISPLVQNIRTSKLVASMKGVKRRTFALPVSLSSDRLPKVPVSPLVGWQFSSGPRHKPILTNASTWQWQTLVGSPLNPSSGNATNSSGSANSTGKNFSYSSSTNSSMANSTGFMTNSTGKTINSTGTANTSTKRTNSTGHVTNFSSISPVNHLPVAAKQSSRQNWIMWLPDDWSDSEINALAEQFTSHDVYAGHPSEGGLPVLMAWASQEEVTAMVSNLKSEAGSDVRLEKDSEIDVVVEQAFSQDIDIEDGSRNIPPWGLDRIDGKHMRYDGMYLAGGEDGGRGVHVYVMDTGIRTTHGQFGGRAMPSIEASSGKVKECNTIDTTCASDDNGHGTLMAGAIGGSSTGVAQGSWLHAVKILNSDGKGQLSSFLVALDWILVNGERPAVISAAFYSKLSPSDSKLVKDAIDRASSAGIAVVVAASNGGGDACSKSPPSLTSAITVAASTETDTHLPDSSLGKCVDLFAPGRNIRSAGKNSDIELAMVNGTSVAAAYVAGATALILGISNYTSVEKVVSDLLNNSYQGVLTGDLRGSPNLLLGVTSTVGLQEVWIGPSDTNNNAKNNAKGNGTRSGEHKKKCVNLLPKDGRCPVNAGDFDHRLGTDRLKDTFNITVEKDLVCAERLDNFQENFLPGSHSVGKDNWTLDLSILCHQTSVASTDIWKFQTIGEKDEEVVCSGAHPTDRDSGYYLLYDNVTSDAACEELCMIYPGCTGVGVLPNHQCEVWLKNINSTLHLPPGEGSSKCRKLLGKGLAGSGLLRLASNPKMCLEPKTVRSNHKTQTIFAAMPSVLSKSPCSDDNQFQKFVWDGVGKISLEMDPTKCLARFSMMSGKASRERVIVGLVDCQADSPLQMFSFLGFGMIRWVGESQDWCLDAKDFKNDSVIELVHNCDRSAPTMQFFY